MNTSSPDFSPDDRLGHFFSALAICASWSLIFLRGFHVFGVMGMFLLFPTENATVGVPAWIGCGLLLFSPFVSNRHERDKVAVAGASILMLLLVWPIVNGVLASVLFRGWPFALLYWRLLTRVRSGRPTPAWKLASIPAKSPSGEPPNHPPERTSGS